MKDLGLRIFRFSVVMVLFSAALPVFSQKQAAVEAGAAYKNAKLPVEQRVKDLLRRMTLEEKARQLDMYAGVPDVVDKSIDATHAAPDAKSKGDLDKLLGNLGAGSIHDMDANPALSNSIQQWVIAHNRLGIPALFIEEGLHGYNDGTVFPTPLNLAATWDPEVAQKTGAAIAAEMRSQGVDMVLAPVLDLAREPRWGRVEEDFGEDPYLTGQMGLAYVRGAQGDSLDSDHSVIAEPKHFAGHGSPEGGTNTSPGHYGERELRSVMLKPFEPAFREGHARATMAAYHEIDGVPVTSDPLLLKKILRDEWGFQGFVLSDLGAIQRLYTVHHVAATEKEAACLAIDSGVDMQFYDFKHDVFQNALVSCVREGTLPVASLDRAVASVLRVKFELGLFDHPMVDPSLAAKVWRTQEHLDLSLRSARESMTLLKNDGHLLPLAKDTKRITVLGPNANVARYGDYEQEEHGVKTSLLDGLKQAAPNAAVTFDEGKDVAAAIAKTKDADVVILGLGEHQGISGEGYDRASLDLPDNQEALLEAAVATGKPVVLVIENGRPLTIGWAKEHVPAILEAWYPGEFGGKAIAETLFGDNNPAGRLTITFPKSLGQLPDFYNHDPSRKREYVDNDGEPLFAFGYGLSYSTFKYDKVTATAPAAGTKGEVIVTATVTNTGSIDGDEVAQLYLRQDVGSVETPERSLKGFERVHLKAGESKTVTFRVPVEQLAVWNMQSKWAVEKGPYTVWVGGSSEVSDAGLSAKFSLSGVR